MCVQACVISHVCASVMYPLSVRKELFWIGLFVVENIGVKIRTTRLKYAKLTSCSTQMGGKGLATLTGCELQESVKTVFHRSCHHWFFSAFTVFPFPGNPTSRRHGAEARWRHLPYSWRAGALLHLCMHVEHRCTLGTRGSCQAGTVHARENITEAAAHWAWLWRHYLWIRSQP